MTFDLTMKRVMGALMAPAIALGLLAASSPTRAAEGEGPALWKLTDEDSEIWLFGTIHILKPTLEWRTDKINAAFDEAGTLITEAPVHDIDPQAMQGLVMKYGVNRSGTSFLTQISPAALENFQALVVSMGMPAEGVNNFAPYRPWLAGVTIQALKIQAMGGDPEAGVDKMLWKDAQTKGKALAYFETAEEQIQIFGNMDAKDELYFFEEGVRQMIEEPHLMDDIVTIWQAGNTADLAKKMQAAMVGQETLYDVLLTKRNENWADQIKELMEGEGKVFIAVGAAHLAGKDSVQEILKDRYGLNAVRQ